MKILYSPSNNPALDALMKKVAIKFKEKNNGPFWNFLSVGVDDSKALEQYLLENHVFLGVEFDDKLKNLKELSKELKYSILTNDDFSESWKTKFIQRKSITMNYQTRNFYWRSVYEYKPFLCVQNTIDQAFMEVSAPEKQIPHVKLKVIL